MLCFPVAPVSVLRTWEAQIAEHCTSGLLKIYTYHDTSRGIVSSQLQKYDVVITSYNTVAGEFGAPPNSNAPSQRKKKGHNALFGVQWKVNA